jgi:hypothetical protein
MELSNVITAAISYSAGIATEWARGLLSNREIRNAVQAEISPILVHLNFYLMNATAIEDDPALVARYFGQSVHLESFDYYWEHDRNRLLRLPEWTLLRSWADRLGRIGTGPHPALFDVIMLFDSLTIKPLDRCVSRDSMKFVRNVLARPEISTFRLDYMLRASSPKKSTPAVPQSPTHDP